MGRVRHRDAEILSAGRVVASVTKMPADAGALKMAFRKASFVAHPDYGGTDAAFIELRKAYVRVFDKL